MKEPKHVSVLGEYFLNRRRRRAANQGAKHRMRRASPFRVESLEARLLLSADLAGAAQQAQAAQAIVQQQAAPTHVEGAIDLAQVSHEGGYAYVARQDFGTPGDTNDAPTQSVLKVFEDGRELGPAHSQYVDIEQSGGGQFTHYENALWFSASDNSNPLTNGRTYTYRVTTDTASAPSPSPAPSTSYVGGAIDLAQVSHEGGYAYVARQDFGTPGDTNNAPTQSVLKVFENGQELGPAHSQYVDIEQSGGGQFTHYENALWFSASDNSNPLTNGRTYTYAVSTGTGSATPNPAPTPSPNPSPTPTPSPSYVGGTIDLAQVSHEGGYAYVARQDFGTPGDTNDAPTQSVLKIFENGQELGPAHSQYVDIEQSGGGQFTHYENALWFSASDNSNPLTNGRTYTYGLYTAGSSTTPSPNPNQNPTPAGAIKTDMGVYAEPALPSLPYAGSKIVDPTFGTTIMRLTDGQNGNGGAGVMYSYWPSFNMDNSYVAVNETHGYTRAKFFTFDPTSFSAGNGFMLDNPPSGLQEYGLTWSGVSPQLTFGVGENSIWQINVSTQQASLVKDLSAYGTGGHLEQMTKSLNDDVFAASIANGSGTVVGYLVYQRSTDTVLLRNFVSNIDEVQVDKSGRHLIVVYNDGNNEVWDLQAGPKLTATLTQGAGNGFWHRDTGMGTALTAYGGDGLGFRHLATPTSVNSLIPGYWSYNTQQDHFSMLADNELWALGSRYSTNGGEVHNAFDNEIVQVATDGSDRVRRVAHHRSVVTNYEEQPKAAISRDGQFIAFTSNWGNPGGRHDVYIAKVPPAPTV